MVIYEKIVKLSKYTLINLIFSSILRYVLDYSIDSDNPSIIFIWIVMIPIWLVRTKFLRYLGLEKKFDNSDLSSGNVLNFALYALFMYFSIFVGGALLAIILLQWMPDSILRSLMFVFLYLVGIDLLLIGYRRYKLRPENE